MRTVSCLYSGANTFIFGDPDGAVSCSSVSEWERAGSLLDGIDVRFMAWFFVSLVEWHTDGRGMVSLLGD